MEQVIDRMATGLGNAVSFIVDSGTAFIVFALIWAGFAAALIWNQELLGDVWLWVRALPWVGQGLIWIVFLPVMLALWIWQTSWVLILRLILILAIAGWTLLIFPRP